MSGLTGSGGAAVRLREASRDRRRSIASWFRPALAWARPGVVAAVALVVFTGAGWWVSSSSIVTARTIEVTGETHLSRGFVTRLAGVDHHTNVLWLDPSQVEQRLESNPWVADAVVTRSLPSTVRIRIAERTAASAVRVGSTWAVVATDGTVLAGVRRRPGSLPVLHVPMGPVTVGQAPASLVRLAAVAAHMPGWLRTQVGEIVPQRDDDVTLWLRSGTRVLFGAGSGAGPKADALAGVLRWADSRGESLDYVDVRAPAAPAARLGVPGSTAPASDLPRPPAPLDQPGQWFTLRDTLPQLTPWPLAR